MKHNKPNLFIIGASKCGTTSLWNMLNIHPDVFMAIPKEPWFFSFSNYKDKLHDYENLFNNVSTEKIIGEASPIYSETTLIPEIPERIYNYNPNSKIIYIVREPISRLKSTWRQTLHSGHWFKKMYEKYCDIPVQLMPKSFLKAVYEYPAFLEATKYWTHLSNYKTFFRDDKILVLFFEDLKTDPELVYANICSFLDIQPISDQSIFEKKNSSKGKTVQRSWVVNLRQNKLIFKLYKKISRILNLNLQLATKEIQYDIDISQNEKEEIYKKIDVEIANILKYGKKDLKFWTVSE